MFKLSRVNLLSAVDETEQYHEAGLLGKYEEIIDFIIIKNRPNKKLVSSDSITATVASGMFIVGIVPCISPGFDENGAPHIFNLNNFGLGVPETQFMMLLFAIIGGWSLGGLSPSSQLTYALASLFQLYNTSVCW